MNFVLSDAVVLDSSVVIKWFREYEVLREQALQLRQSYLDGHLFICVPVLLIYETADALRYKSGMSRIEVQQTVQSLFNMGISIEHTEPDAMRRVIEIAYSYDLTVYDAVFVALAEQLGADFVTADEKLIQKLNGIHYVHYLANLVH